MFRYGFPVEWLPRDVVFFKFNNITLQVRREANKTMKLVLPFVKRNQIFTSSFVKELYFTFEFTFQCFLLIDCFISLDLLVGTFFQIISIQTRRAGNVLFYALSSLTFLLLKQEYSFFIFLFPFHSLLIFHFLLFFCFSSVTYSLWYIIHTIIYL